MKRRLVIAITSIVLASGVISAQGGWVDHLLHPFRTVRRSSPRSSQSHTGEIVWSGLVMADNAPAGAGIPTELERLEPTLKELFGYNHFDVIGQSRTSLKSGQENWSAASKHFKLHVDAKGPSEGGYVVNLKLIQVDEAQQPPDQMVLETDTKLSKRSPLVIKGPQVGDGQLLLVLVVL
jgi:hypothetical protein